MASVLFVEDGSPQSRTMGGALRRAGYDTRVIGTGLQALAAVQDWRPDAALLDLLLPDMSGVDVAGHVRRRHGDLPLIVMAEVPDYFLAARALNLGVTAWLEKPVKDDLLLTAVASAIAGVRPLPPAEAEPVRTRQSAGNDTFDGMVGRSPVMLELFHRIAKLAPLNVSVLIQGETGTGKELVARSLHKRSGRRDKPFVPVHAGAIPETLFEAQMFGHEAGAFTDAREARPGWFETANGGTLFLDEIGEMPLAAQAKLLRVMEERQVARLGGRPIPIEVRIVAATNRDLETAVESKQFRSDLYNRFSTHLHLPPLTARQGDVDRLIDHFLLLLARELNTHARVTDDARALLRHRSWPGNVRELERVLREALILSSGGLVTADRLQGQGPRHGLNGTELTDAALEQLTWAQALRLVERRLIDLALRRTGGNREAAARLLGIDVKTLRLRVAPARGTRD